VQDLPDGGRRDSYAEFRQFAVDPAVFHSGFSFAKRTARRAMLWTVGGRPGLRRLLVSYFFAVSFAVPGQQSRGRDRKDLAPAPARYEPCQRSEPGPINGLVSRPADVAAQYRVLVAQNQQLGVLGQITTEQHDQQPEHGTDDHVNEGEDHPR
jgi:hypothetical protein